MAYKLIAFHKLQHSNQNHNYNSMKYPDGWKTFCSTITHWCTPILSKHFQLVKSKLQFMPIDEVRRKLLFPKDGKTERLWVFVIEHKPNCSILDFKFQSFWNQFVALVDALPILIHNFRMKQMKIWWWHITSWVIRNVDQAKKFNLIYCWNQIRKICNFAGRHLFVCAPV